MRDARLQLHTVTACVEITAKFHEMCNYNIVSYLTLPYHSRQAFYRLALRPPVGPMRIT